MEILLLSQIGGAGLPVMVYIHGGAFIIGSESQYQPDYILDKPVVLVIFNYRLGVFGIQIRIIYLNTWN